MARRLARACLLGGAQASQRMSALFSTYEALARADGVAGVGWAELQRRCEPGAGPGQTQGGWISDGAPIRDVLEEDWTAVARAGTTHLELAAHLDAVWARGRVCSFEGARDEVEYDVRSLNGNTLSGERPQSLKISCMHTRGIQQDLIHPENWFEYGWNVDWTLSNGKVALHFGGRNSSAGIVQYIRDFGFYEGGKDNSYRIDPLKLIELLTGMRPAPSQ
uniref:Uncharacterized protein n=1 Tax=Alexandrium catenella TaxID=2925 RepID=A0A7S1WIV5_ALECA|mmetsp:Transcript_6495/g.17545  ORF Transcript_6495/g.17545 Transcript_6495/m.17545 type:complete len:220 (+) Transcript_6495:75-734(+)